MSDCSLGASWAFSFQQVLPPEIVGNLESVDHPFAIRLGWSGVRLTAKIRIDSRSSKSFEQWWAMLRFTVSLKQSGFEILYLASN
jgi:hypothetical protein